MVKRISRTGNSKSVLASPKKRRNRAPRGQIPCRSSLRCRGICGDDPLVQFPNGMPVFRFPASEYSRPICRMYGVDRNFKYKGFFFCTNCQRTDESLTTKGMIRSSYDPNSKNHSCEANHQCYAFPTDRGIVRKACNLSKTHYATSLLVKQRESRKSVSWNAPPKASTVFGKSLASKRKGELMTEVSKLEHKLLDKDVQLYEVGAKVVDLENALSMKNLETERAAAKLDDVSQSLDYTMDSLRQKGEESNLLAEENKKMKELLHCLQDTLRVLREHLRTLGQQWRRDRDKVASFEGQRTDSLVATICDLLALVTNTKNCSRERKASAFADLFLDGSVLDGVLSKQIRKKFTNEIRSTIFSAPALMKKMDDCGFTINYAALDAISDMESSVMGKYNRGLFPSTKTIKRSMEIVHAFGDNVLPFTLTRFPEELGGGELAKFPQELVLKALVKFHGLLEKAKSERVGVGYAYDGTKIDSRTYLEISGFKVTDRDAKDPKTGRLLYGNGIQSSACSFPDTLGIAKDTKEVFSLYKPRFERIAEEAAQQGKPMLGTFIGAEGQSKDYKYVEGTSEMDMKTVWMVNNVGCAAKQGGDDVMFCSFCPLTNRDIAKGTKNLCHKWCRQYGRDK